MPSHRLASDQLLELISWQILHLQVQDERHNPHGMKPRSGHNSNIREVGIHYDEVHFHNFRPCLNRSRYMISTPLPRSTSTLFTPYPPILSVTTRASSCGYKVPILSSSKKLKTGQISTLPLFESWGKSSVGVRAIDITLEGWEPILLREVRMTPIVPIVGLVEASLWAPDSAWLPCP